MDDATKGDVWEAVLEHLLSTARRNGTALNLYRRAVALRGQLATVTAERDDARAEVETLRAEAALMREIIEGRTTPPTDAEIEAHAAAGCGWWLIVTEHSFDYDMPDAVARDEWVQAGAVRWCPCADDGRPCAWPTVTP